MKIFLDANVLVAGCLEEHEHHGRALPLLAAARSKQTDAYTSGHALLESYSAMTRIPRTPRMLAAQAMMLLQDNVVNHFTLVTLSGKEYSELLLKIVSEGILGEQTYDALHLACAEKCGAERIYTFNARHFQTLASERTRARIVSP